MPRSRFLFNLERLLNSVSIQKFNALLELYVNQRFIQNLEFPYSREPNAAKVVDAAKFYSIKSNIYSVLYIREDTLKCPGFAGV